MLKRRLKEPFGKAGLVVAVVALVFAMLGGAYAATGGNGGGGNSTGKEIAIVSAKAKQGKQGKTGKTGKTGPQGPAGPAGPGGAPGAKGDIGAAGANGTDGTNGADGTNGTNGVSTTSKSFTGKKTLGSEKCEEGGTEVTSAGGTTLVCNGKAGQTGFTETLPRGKTETGTWSGGTTFKRIPISFAIPVEPAPTLVYVRAEGTQPGCPGITASGLPLAEEGKLCVYAGLAGGDNPAQVTGSSAREAIFGNGIKSVAEGVGPAGTVLEFQCGEPEAEFCRMEGVWAVTAGE